MLCAIVLKTIYVYASFRVSSTDFVELNWIMVLLLLDMAQKMEKIIGL